MCSAEADADAAGRRCAEPQPASTMTPRQSMINEDGIRGRRPMLDDIEYGREWRGPANGPECVSVGSVGIAGLHVPIIRK